MLSRTFILLIQFFFVFISGFSNVYSQNTKVISHKDIHHPVSGQNGIVATQEALATDVGLNILREGGNAIDAAVAIGFTLAVTLPRAGNLGGGGFMLIHSAESERTIAIDYRETAPLQAHPEMYLDSNGNVDTQKARFSYQSVGVPGTVAGMILALEKYGTLTLAEVIAPAIKLARDGFQVRQDLANSLKDSADRLSVWPQSKAVFFKNNGQPYQTGERLIQSDLAWTLQQIAENGQNAFYKGEIAHRIANDMTRNGGLITEQDLAGYKAVIREPINGEYRGFDIRSMPPPSSGGIHLIQILNILEDYPIAFLGANSADTIHLMAEAMKLAYADRSLHLGDPDFWDVPAAGLTSKEYARKLRERITLDRATPSTEILPGNPLPYESNETTHYSVMDRFGNAVSNTYTINFGYGTGIIATGTGILLNNEMDDFSAKPGVPNAYGLIGGAANSIEPIKRPLSSMTPTILLKDGKPFLATGSPGGSRIISTTAQIVLNVIDHKMNIASATASPRVHHQWFPDELRIEKGLSPDTIDILHQKGHKIVTKWAMGSTQSVMHNSDGFFGFSDSRRPGAKTAAY